MYQVSMLMTTARQAIRRAVAVTTPVAAAVIAVVVVK
jgi:hypothetical protein